MDTHTKALNNLEFRCKECNSGVCFSVLDNQDLSKTLTCEKCSKKYVLGSQILDQLKQFEALCKQIQLSKNIFGQAAIAIDVGPHQVKIPFQLLLTRLSSVLELNVGGENTTIAFRVDTLKGHSLGEK
jgi:hypothetical protein